MTIAPSHAAVLGLTEWEGTRLVGAHLAEEDRSFVARLAADDRLIVEEVIDGLRITATSWIGVIQLRGLEIRIVPKYAGGDLGVLRMLDYASGFGALDVYAALRTLVAEGVSLIDLLGWVLADRATSVVRAGPMADYVAREDELLVLRGRLRVLDQVRRRFGRVERLECAFDEHETDILENQVLGAAVAVARRACSDPVVVARLARLDAVFEGICDPSLLDPKSAREAMTYNRRNEYYRSAHAIAWLFLPRRGVDDVFASGATESFAFLLDMNQLFEDFVTRLLRDALEPTGTLVLAQRRDRSIVENELTQRPYAAVIPDVLLEDRVGGRRIRMPVDAKYKLYDERRLEPSDVYQAFFYAYAYHRPSTMLEDVPVALLMYPSAAAGSRTALRVRRAEGAATARIGAIGVDVPATLDAIARHSIWSLPEVLEVRRALGHLPAVQGAAIA